MKTLIVKVEILDDGTVNSMLDNDGAPSLHDLAILLGTATAQLRDLVALAMKDKPMDVRQAFNQILNYAIEKPADTHREILFENTGEKKS